MNSNEYLKQVVDLKLQIVTKPRTYIQWNNTEDGRDKTDCYERIDEIYVRYVNTHNPSMVIIQGDKFFDTLEMLYNLALSEKMSAGY